MRIHVEPSLSHSGRDNGGTVFDDGIIHQIHHPPRSPTPAIMFFSPIPHHLSVFRQQVIFMIGKKCAVLMLILLILCSTAVPVLAANGDGGSSGSGGGGSGATGSDSAGSDGGGSCGGNSDSAGSDGGGSGGGDSNGAGSDRTGFRS